MAKIMGWGEDPIWGAHVKVSVSVLRSLEPALPLENCGVLLLPGGRAVEKFRLLGTVVSAKHAAKNVAFSVDDGTGTLACIWWSEEDWNRPKPLVSQEAVELGRLVHVGGTLKWYQGQMQLNVSYFSIETNSDAEALFWLETISLYKADYSEPPVRESQQQRDAREAKKARGDAQGSLAIVGVDTSQGDGACADHLDGPSTVEACVRSFVRGHSSFTYQEFKQDAAVRACAEEAAGRKKEAGNWTKETLASQATRLAQTALFTLRKNGEVWQKDEEKDVWEELSFERHVVPFCEDVIRDVQARAGGDMAGCCHWDDIKLKVKSDKRMSCVHLDVVRRALAFLETNTRIFASADMEYKILV